MRIINQSKLSEMKDLSPELDEQAEQKNRAEDDRKSEKIGRRGAGLDVEAERGSKRGDDAGR